mmetsp:Transcript_96557/g.166497  ORF Transcript_96557/g.166497 Transcript_96557/m.166497 type:complete len:279 (-) Transcript_96557:290-1126(-)
MGSQSLFDSLLAHPKSNSTRASMINLKKDVRWTGLFSVSAAVLVWILPLLSQWCDPQDFARTESLGEPGGIHCVAYSCAGFPRCDDSNMGVSISGFIMTPPATGMMAIAFSWPILHLWKIAEWIDRTALSVPCIWCSEERLRRIYHTSMYVFQLAFGLFVICTADYFPIGHNLAMGITFIAGAVTYSTLMLQTTECGHRLTSFILLIAIVSFVLVLVINVSHPISIAMKVSPFVLKDYKALGFLAPWLFWIIEALGLSCMGILPLVFEIEVVEGLSRR